MYKNIKRSIDITVSLIGIILLLPILFIVAVMIKMESKGPIFFIQERIGFKGQTFKIYKFRSMVINAEKSGVYELKNDVRVTKVGKVIRALSIDEIPQFINILKGDMSLVGPRPTLTYHPWKLDEYSNYQKKRFNVKPGVTGLAQINGRKGIDWNKRIEFDVHYSENLSLMLDCKICILTFIKVLRNKDNLNISENTTTKNEVLK